MEILGKTNDGFAIAEADLQLRGPGELFGLRQSGELAFQIADIYRDADLLLLAQNLLQQRKTTGMLDTESRPEVGID